MPRRLASIAFLAFFALAACEEQADAPGVEAPPEVPEVRGPNWPTCDPDTVFDPGPTLPRRLTAFEYANTVRDLLGPADDDLTAGFPPEEEMLGFDNNARALSATPLHTEQYMSAAERLADQVIARLGELAPCPAEVKPERECAATFIADFGRRAWRRPLTTQERGRLLALYDRGAAFIGSPFENGLAMVVEALLQSPNFLYRIEVGEPVEGRDDDLRRLTDYEIASRLSYLVWRSMPDEALFAAAEAGALRTAEQIEAQADRLLADPRARDAFWTFFAQWLHLDEVDRLVRDTSYYPGFDDFQRTRMAEEARTFVEDAAWGGSLRTLFDGVFTVPGETPGLDRRVGILTQPALLAVTSKPNMTSPVHRGVFVREQLLCTALPPPPPNLMVVPPNPDPTQTTRQQFIEHSANPVCAGCHALIDPLGLGFENYDAVGAWRETQNGWPIDATGEVTGTYDADGAFTGVVELSRRLAESQQVHRCLTTQLFRYAYGRGESDVDACALDALYRAYMDADYNFGAMVRALVVDDSFRYRRGEPE